jgi:large subunit ribosomal protein L23
MSRSPDRIVRRPVVSEKSYASMALGRYVFRCAPDATKVEIKRAIEEAFADQKIQVVDVNTLNVRGKERLRSRGRRRIVGHSPNWKKAIVTLAPGQKIEGLFEGI